MHRFILYQRGRSPQDITRLVSSPQMRDEPEAISLDVSMTVLRNHWNDPYAHWPGISPGDKLRIIHGDREVFDGTILVVGQDGSIQAANPGWNLTKSQINLQLHQAAAPDAVCQMCEKAGIPPGAIDLPPTRISKVWWGSTPESILRDILAICSAETGVEYRRRVQGGRLQIYPLSETPIILRHQLPGQPPFDASLAKGAISGTDSAEKLVNAVVLTAGRGKERYVLATARNEESIRRFGLLQQVETLSGDETQAEARQRIRNLLQQGDRIIRERTIDHLWGDDNAISGALVRFEPNRYDVSGVLRLRSVTHTYGPQHTMSVSLLLPESRSAGGDDIIEAKE